MLFISTEEKEKTCTCRHYKNIIPTLACLFFFVALSEQKVQTFSESKRINVIRYIYHKAEYDLDYLQTQFLRLTPELKRN